MIGGIRRIRVAEHNIELDKYPYTAKSGISITSVRSLRLNIQLTTISGQDGEFFRSEVHAGRVPRLGA